MKQGGCGVAQPPFEPRRKENSVKELTPAQLLAVLGGTDPPSNQEGDPDHPQGDPDTPH